MKTRVWLIPACLIVALTGACSKNEEPASPVITVSLTPTDSKILTLETVASPRDRL